MDGDQLWGLVGFRSHRGRTDRVCQAHLNRDHETAHAQVDAVAQRIGRTDGSVVGSDFAFRVEGLHERFARVGRDTLLLLSTAVGALFLVTCMTITGIRAAQFVTRGRELAVRTSLGASRSRLAAQLVVESGVLSLGGAVLGVGMAWMLAQPLNALVPPSFLRAGPIAPDWRVAAVAVLLGVVAGLLSTLVPIARIRRGVDFAVLRVSSSPTASLRGQKLLGPRALLIPQYAISLATIVVMISLVRTLLSLGNVDPGFSTQGKVALEMDVPNSKTDQVATYQRQLAEAVTTVPGVTGVAFAYSLPLAMTSWRAVSPGFFDAMDMSVIGGRVFHDVEIGGAAAVVVSRALAERVGGVTEVLGTRIRPRYSWIAGVEADQWLEVIGVVPDLHDLALGTAPGPVLLTPSIHRTLDGLGTLTWSLRSTARPRRR